METSHLISYKNDSFLNQCLNFRNCNTNSWCSFSDDFPLIVPAIASQAFY